jgi:D-alanine-D-alanine ligase
MKIALLHNQKPDVNGEASPASDQYAEWDHPKTIQAVIAALGERHQVVAMDCNPAKLAELVTRLIREQPDICFNMVEGIGSPSREAQVPALLEMLGLRYTASDVLTLATTLDKARTKEILAFHQIATPAFWVVRCPSELAVLLSAAPAFPLIVKPLHEGSSKGIFERSVVDCAEGLRRQICEVTGCYGQPAIVEAFLPGREFTVALMGNGPTVVVLPIVEILFDSLPRGSKRIYSYEAKWLWDDPSRPVEVSRCPALLDPDLQAEIETLCRRAYRALRCRDWARIDVRLDAADRPNILEINPLPGVLPDPDEHSCLPAAARAAGLTYSQLINRVLDEALLRYGLLPGAQPHSHGSTDAFQEPILQGAESLGDSD